VHTTYTGLALAVVNRKDGPSADAFSWAELGAAALKPLFESVKSTIRNRLESETYLPGDKIPSETALVKEFGVSAITVRRALRDLVVEGKLTTRPGIGVFVAGKTKVTRSLDTDFIFSLGERMKQSGIAPALQEISLELVHPDPAIQESLNVSSQSFVYRHEKLILADGEPVSLDITYLPETLGRQLRGGLSNEFVIPLLRDKGVALNRIRYRLEAGSATERERNSLNVPIGSPLLSVHYMPIGFLQKPLLVGHIVSRADMFAYELSVNVPAKEVRQNGIRQLR
jgi:GntR family transcriptional regulator